MAINIKFSLLKTGGMESIERQFAQDTILKGRFSMQLHLTIYAITSPSNPYNPNTLNRYSY